VSRTIAVISVKGGVGKSTSAISLGIWTTKLTNEWVLILDGDPEVRSVELKLCPAGKAALADVLHGRKSLKEAVRPCDLADPQKNYLYPRLLGLPAGERFLPPLRGTLLGWLNLMKERLDGLMTNLRERWVTPDGQRGIPHIFIDTPASYRRYEHLFLYAAADGVIYVVDRTPESMDGIARAERELRFLFGDEPKTLGVIANNIPDDEDVKALVKRASEIAPVLGVVPRDPTVDKAFASHYPFDAVAPDCPANLAFKEIAAKLLKMKLKPTKLSTKIDRALLAIAESEGVAWHQIWKGKK